MTTANGHWKFIKYSKILAINKEKPCSTFIPNQFFGCHKYTDASETDFAYNAIQAKDVNLEWVLHKKLFIFEIDENFHSI